MSRGYQKTEIPSIVQDFIDATLPDEKFGQFLSVVSPEIIKTRKVSLDDIAQRLRAIPASYVSDSAISSFVQKMQESSVLRKTKIKPAKINQFVEILEQRLA